MASFWSEKAFDETGNHEEFGRAGSHAPSPNEFPKARKLLATSVKKSTYPSLSTEPGEPRNKRETPITEVAKTKCVSKV